MVVEFLQSLPTWATPVLATLAVLGAVHSLQVLATVFQGLGYLFYGGVNVKKFGEWVVVTGATDGIGLGYAKQFARNGMNLVLISRSAEKLKQVENDIKAQNAKIQIKTIAADFSSTSAELYSNIASQLKGLSIAALVNNVGISYPHAQYFDKVDDTLIEQLININVVALTKMTKIVLPEMVEKKKGIIINVGSAAGVIPIGDPLYSVYSGTKAYVDFFSKSLNLELKSKGIIVENHIPYFVTSKLSKIRNASLTTPNPSTYARAAVAKIGYSASTVPYWTHAIQHWLMCHLPTFIVTQIVMSHHIGVYKRAMKKQAENKQQ